MASCIVARGNYFEGDNTNELLSLNSAGIFERHLSGRGHTKETGNRNATAIS
jgi:hypothetical protein